MAARFILSMVKGRLHSGRTRHNEKIRHTKLTQLKRVKIIPPAIAAT